MNTIEQKIYKMKPRYLSRHKQMIERYAQYGGGADGKRYVTGRYFSNVYEMYIFAFFLGLNNKSPYEILEDDKLQTFIEIEDWKPTEIRDYIIACSIAKANIDMFSLQNLSETEIAQEVRKLKKTIESYANGGLQMIANSINDDPDNAESDTFFINMLA